MMHNVFSHFRLGSILSTINTFQAKVFSSQVSPKISPTISKILKAARRTNDGRLKAKISPIALARIRKRYIMQGKEWPQEPLPPINLKPYRKGHKWEKAKAERIKAIAENMEKMPQMIADYRKQVKERRDKYKKRKAAAKSDPNQPEYVQYLLAKGIRLSDIAVKLKKVDKKAKI